MAGGNMKRYGLWFVGLLKRAFEGAVVLVGEREENF